MRLIDADPPGISNDAVRSVEGAIRVNEDLIASLRDVIYQIEDYAARSVGIYARARSAVDVLREAGVSVKSCLVGNGYGDLSWADGFAEGDDELVAERLGVSKEDFVTMQRDQFGFNAETAETMWDIYAALYRRYPDLSQEKIDWHWLRIMSNIDYDSVSWSFTCGDVVGVDSDGKACIGDDFVTKVLGVNVDRYAKMRLEIAMQHAVASGFLWVTAVFETVSGSCMSPSGAGKKVSAHTWTASAHLMAPALAMRTSPTSARRLRACTSTAGRSTPPSLVDLPSASSMPAGWETACLTVAVRGSRLSAPTTISPT